MAKFRKKPVVIDAIIFDGDNYRECEKFLNGNYDNTLNYPNVRTHEGVVSVSVGDYVVRGVKDDYYPCKPDIFEATHELVE